MNARHLSLALLLPLALTASARAGLELYDSGTHTRQIAADGSTLYILKDSGEIWRARYGQFDQIDNGSGTRQIAAGDGELYLLKENGTVMEYRRQRWTPISPAGDYVQLTVGRNRLYALRRNGNMHRYRNREWRTVDTGTGTKQIHAHGTTVWILKDNGNVVKFDDVTGRFDKVDNGTHTRMITGDDHDLYILKENGELWQAKFGEFSKLDHDPGYTRIALDWGRLFALHQNGDVRRFDLTWGSRDWVRGPGQVVDITAAQDTLYLQQRRGNVWTWTPSPWAPSADDSHRFEELHGVE